MPSIMNFNLTINVNNSESNLSTPPSKNNFLLNHFFTQFADSIDGAWYRLKDCIKKPTELEKRIREIAKNQYWTEEDQSILIKAFISNEYPRLTFFISKIIKRLDDNQLNNFVKELFIAQGIEQGAVLIKKMKGLFSLQKIERMIRSEFPSFKTTKELMADIKMQNMEERKALTIEYHRTLQKTAMIYLHQTIDFILNMLIYITRLKQFLPGGQSTPIDSFTGDLQYQAFLNNIIVFSGWLLALSAYTGSMAAGAAIMLAGIAGISSIAYVYNNYLKPAPNIISGGFRNLTQEALSGNFPKVFGRDNEIRALIDSLCSNNETTRRHPILTGQTRVGKTEIVNGLVHYINADLVPDELKNKKVFIINTGSLTFSGAIDKMLAEIKGHESDYIIFFDEFHTIFSGNKNLTLINRFKSLLDPGNGGLKHCIFATTKKEFIQYFSNEAAMLARLFELEVKPLNNKEIYPVLRDMLDREASDLIVDLEALEAVANVHLTLSEYTGASQPFTSKVLLSQVLSEVRNYKCTVDEAELQNLKNEKLEILSKGVSLKVSDLLISNAGAERNQKIQTINLNIQKLEERINESKKKANQFFEIVKESNHLRLEMEKTACMLSKNPSDQSLQEFILRYYYLQNAYYRNIEMTRNYFPDAVVNLDRMNKHIEAEAAKIKAKNGNLNGQV